jgi:hypothetical protein
MQSGAAGKSTKTEFSQQTLARPLATEATASPPFALLPVRLGLVRWLWEVVTMVERIVRVLALLVLSACGEEKQPVTCQSYAEAVCEWIATCEGDFDNGDVTRCRNDVSADCENGLLIDYEGCADAVEHANCDGYPTHPSACRATGQW